MPVTIDGTLGISTPAPNIQSSSLAVSPTAGEIEYDGASLYFTPIGSQRGIIPGMQFFRLGSGLVGQNATGNQNALGVGVTLSSGYTYAFEVYFTMLKVAGTTSHIVNIGWNGTAIIGNYNYSHYTMNTIDGTSVTNTVATNRYNGSSYSLPSTAAVIGSSTSATRLLTILMKGTMSITSGGTLAPIYALSAAPGGAYTTESGSYMLIYPVGIDTGNTVVGTWA